MKNLQSFVQLQLHFIKCLVPKGKLPKHTPSHQITEENTENAGESEVDLVIVFPRLKELYLVGMPKFRVFYNGNDAIECPSLEELTINGCNNMECLSYGSFSSPKTNYIFLKAIANANHILKWLRSEQKNKILRVEKCNEIKYLVESNLLRTLFSGLEVLRIQDMDSLEEVWHGPYLSNVQTQPCFSHLTEVSIWKCPKLKHVFPVSVATELKQLEILHILECKEIEEIFYKEGDENQISSSMELNSPTTETASTTWTTMEENTEKLDQNVVDGTLFDAVIFPRLQLLILEDMSVLRIFYGGNHALELPSLTNLEIKGCPKIEALSSRSFKATNLLNIQIDVATNYYKWREDVNTMFKKTEDEDEYKEFQWY